VYETVPPGGDLLQQEHVDHIRAVENAVASAPHYADFCGLDDDDEDDDELVATTTCRPPLSLLSVATALQSDAREHPDGEAAMALAMAAAMTGGDTAPGTNASSSSSSSSVSDAALLSLARSLPSLDQYVGTEQKLFSSQHDVTWFFDQAFLERRASVCTSLRSAFVFALPLEGCERAARRPLYLH
jgi:hypothetical protein